MPNRHVKHAARWLVDHVPTGPLAPWLVGLAIGARPHEVKEWRSELPLSGPRRGPLRVGSIRRVVIRESRPEAGSETDRQAG